MIASHSLILAKNLFPNPSPLDAPLTKPAISTNVILVGIIILDEAIFANFSNFWSGTATSPVFGSIVQKGKLAVCALDVFVSALKRVDFPTLGSPIIPVLNPITYHHNFLIYVKYFLL